MRIFVVSVFIFVLYEFGILNLKIFKDRRLVDRAEITCSLPGEIKLSEDLIWAAAGLLSIFGTLLIGFALSYLIRPIFIVRYLFPVTPVLYLTMGFCLSKLHFKRLWAVILTVGILCVNLPAYADTYQTDRELDRENTRFLSAVNPPADAAICTNDTHLAWTLLEYYYPENRQGYSADPMEVLDWNCDEIWLIWVGEIEETVQAAMEEQGSDLEWQYEGRFASGATYHVYKLNRKG